MCCALHMPLGTRDCAAAASTVAQAGMASIIQLQLHSVSLSLPCVTASPRAAASMRRPVPYPAGRSEKGSCPPLQRSPTGGCKRRRE